MHLETLFLDADGLTILASSVAPDAPCPRCGQRSQRVHSRYARTLADLPWATLVVQLRVRVRKFFNGGEAGARLARKLGLPISPDTLLWLIRRDADGVLPTPTVLGVDDWAIQKGLTYGTILIVPSTCSPTAPAPAWPPGCRRIREWR